MPRLTTRGVCFSRFESDAETLRFPKGGVYGAEHRAENPFRIGVPDVANELTRTLSRMQDEINRLRDEVEHSAHFNLSDSWPPKAA